MEISEGFKLAQEAETRFGTVHDVDKHLLKAEIYVHLVIEHTDM